MPDILQELYSHSLLLKQPSEVNIIIFILYSKSALKVNFKDLKRYKKQWFFRNSQKVAIMNSC